MLRLVRMGNYIDKLTCEKGLKSQEEEIEAAVVQPTRMGSTISMAIHGTDTMKTINIKRVENWQGTQESVDRFVNTYTTFGVINVLAVLAAMVFVIAD